MSQDAAGTTNAGQEAGTAGQEAGTAGAKDTKEPYLGSWETKEAAAEGLKNLQTKLSEQGNETGALRKQLEHGQLLMQEMQQRLQTAETAQKSKPTHGDDTANEQDQIAKQIADLDPVDEGYSAKLMSLINKSNAIAAKKTQEAVLAAATETFRKELDERDIKSTHQAFLKANPEFSTPEMQMRINEYISRDSTGMSDPLVAYREIQRDDAATEAKRLTEQNAELQKLLSLKKGTDGTGTVIKSGQGDQSKTKKPIVKGAERNKGMSEILNKMRNAQP